MANRNEFGRQAKVDMLKRATRSNGQVYCELNGCGPLKKWEYHHKDMDAMQIDKKRKLTADEGLVACIPCHDEETAKQAPILAKAKATEAKHLRAVKPKGAIKARPKKPVVKEPDRNKSKKQPLPYRPMFVDGDK